MNYANIKHCDIANGTGVRTTLFVSGCRLRCKGCFNYEAWDFSAGEAFTDEVAEGIVESLRPSYIDGLSILGGEPFEPENQAGLVGLVERVRAEVPGKSIWMYSGHTWEELTRGEWHTDVTDRILARIDVLVDGPWREDEYDISLRFRGSANQRIIDVPSTLEAHAAGELSGNEVVLWEDDPLFASHDLA